MRDFLAEKTPTVTQGARLTELPWRCGRPWATGHLALAGPEPPIAAPEPHGAPNSTDLARGSGRAWLGLWFEALSCLPLASEEAAGATQSRRPTTRSRPTTRRSMVVLKLGMPLVLLRNMSDGLMNGSRLILIGIEHHVLRCRVLSGRRMGHVVYLPRFTFPHEGPDQPLKWSRRQFPVKPCWAFTITKSQGQTFASVMVCLAQFTGDSPEDFTVDAADCFAHGQLYVALSRCGDPEKVCVYTTAERLAKGTALNVVYPEALPCGEAGQQTGRYSGPVQYWPSTSDVMIDSDVVYDPRAHIDERDESGAFLCQPLEVPWHGYVFDNVNREMWQGNEVTPHEMAINCRMDETDEFLENVLNGMLSECDECDMNDM